MRANNVLGIIYASTYDQSLPELTNMRTMGSVPVSYTHLRAHET